MYLHANKWVFYILCWIWQKYLHMPMGLLLGIFPQIQAHALADLRGVCRVHTTPYGTQFFCFHIHFNRKAPASEVHAPPPPLREILDPSLPWVSNIFGLFYGIPGTNLAGYIKRSSTSASKS